MRPPELPPSHQGQSTLVTLYVPPAKNQVSSAHQNCLGQEGTWEKNLRK